MDKFAAFSTFITVAEKNGFAKAARKLGHSPTAVTRTIGALEQHLGVRLFNRTTRALSLTDAGQRFLDRARAAVLALEEAEQEVDTETATPRGNLKIAAPLVFGRLFVSPLLCEYKHRNPAVRVELNLDDRFSNLVEDGFDGAFRIGNLPDASFKAKKLGAVRRVMVASPQYLKKHGTPRSPADLARHKLISLSALTENNAWHFFSNGKMRKQNVEPDYITNDVDAALWHACQDGGITFAISYSVKDFVKQKSLVILMPEFEPAPYPIQFAYPSSQYLPAKTRALIDLVSSTREWDFTKI